MIERQSICLNGLWNFCPGGGVSKTIPETWEETKIVVPCPWNINSFARAREQQYENEGLHIKGGEYRLYPQYPQEWDNAKSGWYRTEFMIPEEWRSCYATLCFKAVHFDAEYYINGRLVSHSRDGFLPHEFQLGENIRYGGMNTLTVYVKSQELFYFEDNNGSRKIEYPTGSFWGMHIAGIWQDVFLNAYPRFHIRDVFVYTDTDKKMLNAEVELSDTAQGEYTLDFTLREFRGCKVFKAGNVRIRDGEKKIHFTYDYSAAGEEIALWWPHSPQLYFLDTVLIKDGEIADIKSTRFGFRSFGIRGKKFFLNEIPYNLRNDSWHYMGFAYQKEEYARLWYAMAKECNANSIRLHAQVYPEFFLDIADEEGMLIIDESSVWASHCCFHYSMTFIENCREHIERMIMRDRNHPCVIIWSVENECVMAYKVSADNAVENEEELNSRLSLLLQHAKSLDGTRPVSGDGNYDYGGRMDLYSVHYPGKSCPAEVDKPVTIGEMGSMFYSTPDCVSNIVGERTYLSFNGRLEALGGEIFENLKHQRKWAAQVCVFNLVWYGLYPIPFRQSIREYDNYNTPGIKPSKIDAYISTLNAGYDGNLPDYVPNPIFYRTKEAFIPERTFFEDGKTRFYSDEDGIMPISVHNDSIGLRQYTLFWSLAEKGDAVKSYNRILCVGPSSYERLELRFKLPMVEAVEAYVFKVELTENGEHIFDDSCPIKVYNRGYLRNRLTGCERIIVAGEGEDAGNAGDAIASALGIRRVSPADAEKNLDQYDIFVMTGQADPSVYKHIQSSGKTIVELCPGNSPYSKWIQHKEVMKAFINTRGKLLEKGLDEQDLYAWNGGTAAEWCLSDSLNANAVPIVTTGKGLSLVSDILSKESRTIVSCLDITRKIQHEPAAAVFLANLIKYATIMPVTAPRYCIVISEENSELCYFLTSIGVSFHLVSHDDKKKIKSLKNEGLVIADGSYTLEYLNELMPGNTSCILIWGMSSTSIPLCIKGELEIVRKTLNQLIIVRGKYITGIHTGDLYGLEAGNEAPLVEMPVRVINSTRVEGILANSDINWRAWNHNGEEIKTIAILRNEKEAKDRVYGMVETSVNGIRTVISQLQPDTGSGKLKKIARILLTNLGAEIRPKTVDAFECIIRDGIYQGRIMKALTLKLPEELKADASGLIPEINKMEKEGFWKRVDLAQQHHLTVGDFTYAFYIYSPQDRTVLLRNPDIVSMEITSGGMKEVLLNDEKIARGNDITISALRLKAGWNKLIILEKNGEDNLQVMDVRFIRENREPLDLDFSLESEGHIVIACDRWTFNSDSNPEGCANAVKGKGLTWNSMKMQYAGMYFQIDLGEVHKISKVQFDSRIDSDSIQWNTPRGFSLLTGIDGLNWSEVFRVKDENLLTLIDGKVILNFDRVKARYVKILLTTVALKPFTISELKIFE